MNYTEQDIENIETYKQADTEYLFLTIEALHGLKKQKISPELEDQADTTISIIRDILIDRNAVN